MFLRCSWFLWAHGSRESWTKNQKNIVLISVVLFTIYVTLVKSRILFKLQFCHLQKKRAIYEKQFVNNYQIYKWIKPLTKQFIF